MNILQILPELNVGGVETGTIDLAKYLARQGHKAVVVSAGGELVKDLERLGVKHYQLPVHKKSIFAICKMVPKITKIIQDENIDIVHARSRVPAWSALFAARKTGKPFITTCHGYYSQHLFSKVMGWGKIVIAPSQVIARHMMDDFDVPHERIRLIPRSVDLEKFKFISPDKKISDQFNVGIVGRITPIKGHTYFLKAMAKVVRAFNRPRVKIWIVGDAPVSKEAYKEEVKILSRRLGLEHCTEFLGTQKDIPTVLSHLNLLVLASTTHEAFGRVITEANASGVPVVATKIGGVTDIVDDNKTGLLVSARDPEAMSNAIIRIIKDSKLACELSEAAYKKVKEKFNVELMVESTMKVYEEALKCGSILIIKFSSLGDVILSTAAMRAIREKFPNHKITFLTSEASKNIVARSPYIDELIVYDYKDKSCGIKAMLKTARDLRRRNFDIVIDLQNNRRSHLLAALSLAVNRYGYNNKKYGFLLNHAVKDDGVAIDPLTHQFRILKLLGIELKDSRLELWPVKEDEEYADAMLESEWLNKNKPLVGINIGASPRWQTKVWPKQHLVKLCEALAAKDIRVVLTGTKDDLSAAEELIHSIKSAKPIVACGKTDINQLACLIKRCSVFISADSAPLHVASAVGIPCIALFGPTDPVRHAAVSQGSRVIKKDLPCSPCYRPKCKVTLCMEKITPEEVLNALEGMLK